MPFVPLTPKEKREHPKPCPSPEHNPPTMIVLSPGTHKWRCPVCGHEMIFTVPEVRC